MPVTESFRKRHAAKWHRLEAAARKQAALWRRRVAFRSRKHKYWHDVKVSVPTQMYDSINLAVIPSDAPAVAGYVGGAGPTYAQLASKFPDAKRVSVAVASRYDADVLDVEPGDATPAVAPAWVRRQQARGVKRPGIYCSVSSVRDVLHTLAAAGIRRDDIKLWTAHYTGTPHVCGPSCGFGMTGTADATQFTDRALGRSLDESRCAPSFWD